MAGHSNHTDLNGNGSDKRVDSTRTNGSIPTSELGKSFAARNINMATLAIQLTAQTSLAPELASGQFHHSRNYKWQQRPFSSTSLPLRPANDTDNASTADTSTTADNDESRSRMSSSRKTVTFNSDFDEIQIFDPSSTPETDSHISDDADELFAAGGDEDLSGDDDSAINIETKERRAREEDEGPAENASLASPHTTDGNSSSSSTVPTMVERELRDEKSLIEARRAARYRKGQRILRDEVLNQLAKRNQIQGTWNSTQQIQNFHAGPTINATKSFQSVESQLMDAILKVKASNQYRPAAPEKTKSMPSLVHSSPSPARPQDLGLATRKSFASYGDTPTQEPILLGYPASPARAAKSHEGDFGKSILNEFDKITSKQTKHYKARQNPTVVHASKTLIDDASVDGSCAGDTSSMSSAARMEPVWREFGSLQTNGHGPPSSDTCLQKGRLYIRVLAAENLDFPIQSDAPQIRCVLSNGTTEHSTEYHTMKHDVCFDHDFSIDVEPSSEFTITLVAGQPQDASAKSSQFRKFLGNRRRSRTDSILRYVNRLDGALAQTRVSLDTIEAQCRRSLCTASFALINGWYQYARLGGIIPVHKKDRFGAVPEKAVGKITVRMFFLPHEDLQIDSLPTNLSACERGLNVQRYSRTCWQTGLMSQLGGDVKFWRRRYFSLRGWRLFSYTDASRSPRVIIDLSKAVTLAADHRIIVPAMAVGESSLSLAGSQHHPSGDRVSIVSSATTGTSEDELVAFSVKNGFRITFINGESIDFFCDSAQERDEWLEVLKVIINRVPSWPDWMQMDADTELDNSELGDSALRFISTTTLSTPSTSTSNL